MSSSAADTSSFSIQNIVDRVLEDASKSQESITAMKNFAEEMTTSYRSLYSNAESDMINFSDPVSRLTYVKQYVRAHAIMLDQAFKQCNELKKFLDGASRIMQHSIGGGPGSDLVGLVHFYKGKQLPIISSAIYDAEVQWSRTWNKVWLNMHLETGRLPLCTTYTKMDITNSEDLETYRSDFHTSNLVTMVKFASAVANASPGPRDFYDMLFKEIPSGCFVVLIDNYAPSHIKNDLFTKACREAAKDARMEELMHEKQVLIDQSAYPMEMDALSQQLGTASNEPSYKPYKPTYMYVLIWRKPYPPSTEPLKQSTSVATANSIINKLTYILKI